MLLGLPHISIWWCPVHSALGKRRGQDDDLEKGAEPGTAVLLAALDAWAPSHIQEPQRHDSLSFQYLRNESDNHHTIFDQETQMQHSPKRAKRPAGFFSHYHAGQLWMVSPLIKMIKIECLAKWRKLQWKGLCLHGSAAKVKQHNVAPFRPIITQPRRGLPPVSLFWQVNSAQHYYQCEARPQRKMPSGWKVCRHISKEQILRSAPAKYGPRDFWMCCSRCHTVQPHSKRLWWQGRNFK